MSEQAPFGTAELGSVVEVLDSQRIPVNSGERMFRQGDVPYYGANGLQGWIDRPIFNEPLILLAEDGGNFDEFRTRPIAYRISGPSWVNNHAHVVRSRAGIDQNFVFWSLVHKDIRRYILGGTRTKLNQSDLKRIEIHQPVKLEQTKIAAILDTLDTAIQRTEAIIEKLKQVKQGLLHDLMTRGIDANGELRPAPTEAPDRYKDSPVGLIPKEWEAASIGHIADRSKGVLQTGPFGAQLHAHEYVNNGIPVIMPQDMVGNVLSEAKIARITERKANTLIRHRLKENDVVFSRRGDLSLCVAIGNNETGWVCGTGCLLARLPESEVIGSWLSTVYRQPRLQVQVMGRAVGSTMANLNASILSELIIPRPLQSEQKEIAHRLTAAEVALNDERLNAEKLQKLKSGLMDDLLTGRVRVTDLIQGGD